MNELKNAANYGLVDIHTFDGYVYFRGNDGQPAPWNGFHGSATGAVLPYAQCPLHTQGYYDEYQQNSGMDGFGQGDIYNPDINYTPDNTTGGSDSWG